MFSQATVLFVLLPAGRQHLTYIDEKFTFSSLYLYHFNHLLIGILLFALKHWTMKLPENQKKSGTSPSVISKALVSYQTWCRHNLIDTMT